MKQLKFLSIVAFAIIIGMALSLALTQIGWAALASTMQNSQDSQVDCEVDVKEPYLDENNNIVSEGEIDCTDPSVQSVSVTLQLQKFNEATSSWNTIGVSSQSASVVNTDTASSVTFVTGCSTSGEARYRLLATGQYQDATGTHELPIDPAEPVTIQC